MDTRKPWYHYVCLAVNNPETVLLLFMLLFVVGGASSTSYSSLFLIVKLLGICSLSSLLLDIMLFSLGHPTVRHNISINESLGRRFFGLRPPPIDFKRPIQHSRESSSLQGQAFEDAILYSGALVGGWWDVGIYLISGCLQIGKDSKIKVARNSLLANNFRKCPFSLVHLTGLGRWNRWHWGWVSKRGK